MNASARVIYEKLIDVAKSGSITYYSDIAPLVGLDMSLPPDRNGIADILDEISRTESGSGSPLLSAVVILKERNIPGDGFFSLARELRLYDGSDDVQFWIREVRRVHDHWTREG